MPTDLHLFALMQDHSAPSSTFLHRTDVLAARLGIRVQELPDVIGVSRRTLFAGRKSDSTVTKRTWLLLADAERDAGINADAASPPEKSEDSAEMLVDHGGIYELGERLGRIESLLGTLIKTLSGKPNVDADVDVDRQTTSSPARGGRRKKI